MYNFVSLTSQTLIIMNGNLNRLRLKRVIILLYAIIPMYLSVVNDYFLNLIFLFIHIVPHEYLFIGTIKYTTIQVSSDLTQSG